MADQETRRRTRAAREAAKDAGASGVSAVPETVAAPKNELDSVEKQDAILNPKPIATTVAGREIALHELPAKQARAFLGLLSLIYAEARERPGDTTARLQGVLAVNPEYSERFAYFVARAAVPAAATPEQLANVPNIAREIDEKATFAELGPLIVEMAQLNGAFSQRPN